ncbi:MAG: 23S rRNA (uracil(1939)-C(5))-methyltransferase RlmD [Chloroflexota bacterium]|nr:23S rRNA (uracil(1939)-C(5))-methyltransferase RlmD [Chloroflexota bacterium]
MTIITLQLSGIAHGGEGLGRHEGKIVFVPYAIPGERVRVEVLEEKARWARARLLEVLEPSADRIEAPCPYFGPGRCGGCQWQHITYERQLALKKEIVVDQLKRLGRVADPPVEDVVALADEDGLLAFFYRNHVQLAADEEQHFGYIRDAEGRSSSRGRKGPAAKDVIAVDRCLLLHPLLDDLHGALERGLQAPAEPLSTGGEDAAEADEKAEPVVVHRVGMRTGVNTGQRLMAFETAGDQVPGFVVEDLPVHCVVRHKDGSIYPLIGDPWIEEIVGGATFRVSAGSFFQVNTVGAEAMVHLASEMLAPQGHEVLIDGYCGVGLFALTLAHQVSQVIAIEQSESACEDFAWNGHDLDNVALFEGSVAEVLAALDQTQHCEIAIIDPPRSGTGREVIEHLHRLGIRRLLYVSCDPATLARDTLLLTDAGYKLRQVQPVDMFPQTYHIESLALFTR